MRSAGQQVPFGINSVCRLTPPTATVSPSGDAASILFENFVYQRLESQKTGTSVPTQTWRLGFTRPNPGARRILYQLRGYALCDPEIGAEISVEIAGSIESLPLSGCQNGEDLFFECLFELPPDRSFITVTVALQIAHLEASTQEQLLIQVDSLDLSIIPIAQATREQ